MVRFRCYGLVSDHRFVGPGKASRMRSATRLAVRAPYKGVASKSGARDEKRKPASGATAEIESPQATRRVAGLGLRQLELGTSDAAGSEASEDAPCNGPRRGRQFLQPEGAKSRRSRCPVGTRKQQMPPPLSRRGHRLVWVQMFVRRQRTRT